MVGDAIDAAIADCTELLPAALLHDLFERDAIAGAAPCGEKNIGVGCGDGFRLSVRAGISEEDAACGVDQFLYPELRMDERLAPFFTVDERPAGHFGGARPDAVESASHFGDDRLAAISCSGDRSDEANVLIDIVEAVRSKREYRTPGFENRGERFLPIR